MTDEDRKQTYERWHEDRERMFAYFKQPGPHFEYGWRWPPEAHARHIARRAARSAA